MLKFAGTIARFSGRAGDELYTAIRDALVERRIPLSFLATDARDVSLDPHYVRCVCSSMLLLCRLGCRDRFAAVQISFTNRDTPQVLARCHARTEHFAAGHAWVEE